MASWKEYLGDRAFYRKIIAIALPISAQQLITVGVNLMDTVMLSSMGDAQLSASALGGQFINLFQIFCMGLGMGASVLTSRYWGMQELKSLRKAVTIMLRLVIGLSMISPEGLAISPRIPANCLIWSLPEKWDFSAAGLSLIVRETPASIRKGLKELEDAGYIHFIRNREGGKFSGDDCLIFSSPCFDFPNAVKPNAVKPNSVNRQQEIKNKEIKNKEIKKEEDPPAEGKLFPGERIRF